jgi:hypothetical protein
MKKHSLLVSAISTVVVASAVVLAPGQARAQTDAAAGTTATPPPTATATTSHAGTGSGAGLGVGAAAFLSGLTGAQVVYDMPVWHIEALLAFDSRDGGGMNPPRITTFDVGVSGWYHLHQGASSDFSLGGGLGMVTRSGGGNSATATVLEVGAQARAFVTANVAVHGRLGVAMDFGDDVGGVGGIGGVNNHVGFGGQLVTGFGFTYFFR